MSEPAGLSMSLDDLIKKKEREEGGGREGRFSGRGGRGAGRTGGYSNLGARGGIHKPYYNNNNNNYGGRGTGRGGFQQQQDGGSRFGRGGGQMQQQGIGRGFGFQNRGGFQQQQGGRGFGRQGVVFGMQAPAIAPAALQANLIQTQQQLLLQQNLLAQQKLLIQQQAEQLARVQQQQQVLATAKSQPQPMEEEEEDGEDLGEPACYLEEDTGNVVVDLGDIRIVTVSPIGDVMLDTGGMYCRAVLNAMNAALSQIGMRISCIGPASNGDWKVGDGRSSVRYTDGMHLVAKGHATASRGQQILAGFRAPGITMQHSMASGLGASGMGMGSSGTGAGFGAQNPDMVRRLKAQGRYL